MSLTKSQVKDLSATAGTGNLWIEAGDYINKIGESVNIVIENGKIVEEPVQRDYFLAKEVGFPEERIDQYYEKWGEEIDWEVVWWKYEYGILHFIAAINLHDCEPARYLYVRGTTHRSGEYSVHVQPETWYVVPRSDIGTEFPIMDKHFDINSMDAVWPEEDEDEE